MRTYDDKMFIETFEHQYTWLNGFMRNVRRYGKKAALIDPATDRSWTYTQLNQEANQPVSYTHLDVYKRQGRCGSDHSGSTQRRRPGGVRCYEPHGQIGRI